jgi:hypothetical protein
MSQAPIAAESRRVMLLVPVYQDRAIKTLMATTGASWSVLVRRAIDEFLERENAAATR